MSHDNEPQIPNEKAPSDDWIEQTRRAGSDQSDDQHERPTPNLTQELHVYYAEQAEALKHRLERAWQRVEQGAGRDQQSWRRRDPPVQPRFPQERLTPMHKPSPLAYAFRHGSSRIATLAAAVLLVVLIGGLVTGLILVRHGGSNMGTAPSSTATPTPPSTTDLSFSTVEMKDAANGWATAFLQSNPTAATHILHTTDGGLHWKDITPQSSTSAAQSASAAFRPLSGGPPTPNSEEFLTGSTAWVLHLPNQLLLTTNGGQTWHSEALPAGQVQQVTFLDAQHGWAITEEVGTDIVFRTTDGGATWTRMQQSGSAFPLGSSFEGLRFGNVTTGWAFYTNPSAANAQGFVVTHDSGATWQPQQLAPAAGETTAVVGASSLPLFFTAQDGVLVGGYASIAGQLRQQITGEPESGAPGNDAIYVTHDGGTTWEGPNTEQGLLDNGSLDFSDTLHGWALHTTWSGINSSTTSLLTTSDSGRHWTVVPTSANATHILGGSLNFVSSQIGWAIGAGSGSLLKTEDGGQTWTLLQVSIAT